jgi:hypothetical protein
MRRKIEGLKGSLSAFVDVRWTAKEWGLKRLSAAADTNLHPKFSQRKKAYLELCFNVSL